MAGLLVAGAVLTVGRGIGTAPELTRAQGGEEARAGLVIAMPDGEVRAMCVTLGVPEISGEALLRRAGIAVAAHVTPLGAMVCALDGQGCEHPTEPCWCACRDLGAGCAYWAYHVREEGAWRYAPLGPSARRVRHGDVDGWAWGTGSLVSGAQPPERSWASLCASDVPPPAASTAEAPSRDPERAATASSPSAGAGVPTEGADEGEEGGAASGEGGAVRGVEEGGGRGEREAAEAAAGPTPTVVGGAEEGTVGGGAGTGDRGAMDRVDPRSTTPGERAGAQTTASDPRAGARSDTAADEADVIESRTGEGAGKKAAEGRARAAGAASGRAGGDARPREERRPREPTAVPGRGVDVASGASASPAGDYLFFGIVVSLLLAGAWWLRRVP